MHYNINDLDSFYLIQDFIRIGYRKIIKKSKSNLL